MDQKRKFEKWRAENASELKLARREGNYSAVLRTGEISVADPECAQGLVRGHAFRAATLPQQFKMSLFRSVDCVQTAGDEKEVIDLLHAIPQGFRDRLDPIFSRPDVFWQAHAFQLRFDEWETNYKAELCLSMPFLDCCMKAFINYIDTVELLIADMLNEIGPL